MTRVVGASFRFRAIASLVALAAIFNGIPYPAHAGDPLSCEAPLDHPLKQCWKGTLKASAGWTVLKKPGGSVALQCDDSWTVDITIIADRRMPGEIMGEAFARKASPLICNPARPLVPMAYMKFRIRGHYRAWYDVHFRLMFEPTGEFGPRGSVDHTEFGLMLQRAVVVLTLDTKDHASGRFALRDAFPSLISRRYGSGSATLECKKGCDYVPPKSTDCRNFNAYGRGILYTADNGITTPVSATPGGPPLSGMMNTISPDTRIFWDQAADTNGVVWYHAAGGLFQGKWFPGTNVNCFSSGQGVGYVPPPGIYGSGAVDDWSDLGIESATVFTIGARG
jgi:hypothetical protein